eukprot:TRINITY_DN8701_c0_g3_i2.p1 TRINITY_DN8701_c0_g3~~TRINITY_DN8701_c0_g3_i2.p1  ORF type:complete len:172 (-),score=26.02 TRINITY_DN8701_c0_g3_i2:328-843(-)
MGNSCSSGQTTVVETTGRRRGNQPNQDYLTRFMSLDNPSNINHRYGHFAMIQKDHSVGKGVKQTFAFKTTLSKEELQKERERFWETRIEGNPLIWESLRNICESKQTIGVEEFYQMCSARLTNQSMQLVFDTNGRKYEVPIFCINDPIAYGERNQNVFDISKVETKTMTVE